MKRKRFVKLLMADGFQRNEIHVQCFVVRMTRTSYQEFYSKWREFYEKFENGGVINVGT